MIWLSPPLTWAKDASKPSSYSPDHTLIDEAEEKSWVDSSHEIVVDQIETTARWFDRFFDDPNAPVNEQAKASIRIILDYFHSGVDGESDFKVRFKGKVDLPRFEKKVRLVFNTDSDETISGYDPVGTESVNRRRENNEGSVGLELVQQDKPNKRLSFGAGFRGGVSDIYLNARYKYTKGLTENSGIRLTPTLYWKSDDGFGVSGLAEYEILPRENQQIRLSAFGDYGEDTNGFEWSLRAQWMHRLNPKTAIGLLTGIQGETEPTQNDEALGFTRSWKEGWLGLRFRRNFFREWLFYEIEPGISWHFKEDYSPEATLALRLEAQFYRD